MAAIFQTTYSNAFSWMKMHEFVPKGPINKIPALVLDNGLALVRRQAIIWTNDG